MRSIITMLLLTLSYSAFSQDYKCLIDDSTWNNSRTSSTYQIICPDELKNEIKTNNKSMINVTKYEMIGSIGYAIDYHLMFIAKTLNNGKSWNIINNNCKMPFALKIINKDTIIVYTLYTAENINGFDSLSILSTQDGGNNWFEIIPNEFKR